MAAGKINLQSNDGKVAGIVFEDGASSNVTVTVPKEGGVVATEAYADTKVSKTGNETISGVKTFTDGLKLQNQNVSPFSGFKNYIINGNFDVAQRGGTHTLIANASGIYHLDRWCSSQTGHGGTQSVQKIFTTVNGVNDVALRAYQVTACFNRIIQILDNDSSKALRGKKMSVSFWYRAKGGISCKLLQRTDKQTLSSDFATLLPDDIGTTIGEASGLTADETWRYASFTTTVSSANGYFHLVFAQNPAVDNYYEIAKVQLEEGSVATPFENRPYGLELSLCQRYYQQFVQNGDGGELYSHERTYLTASVIYITKTIPFKVPMRTAPTITIPRVYNQGTDYDSNWAVYTSGLNGGMGGIAIYKVMSVNNNSIIAFDAIASAEL